ncbi:L_domain-like protein [Hexamita inflata]|uniref:L domain-like protein n=1 Tax=Hexamita inflata TaxID=28002 RepID=A0AA86NQV5_9EUKA|nr:L domain-like protein [Hexamita inflata]CAI9923733.1 L domain-like protein [Hexamita inflata]
MTNSSIENLNQINLLSSLRTLILDNIIDINGAFPLLKNLECISELNNIVELRVPNNDLTDISAVNRMKQLIHLDASMNKLKKIHLECYNLKHADFHANVIECVQQLPAGLSYLDLGDNMLHTIYFNQHEIEYLSLSNNYIIDIRNLTALKNFSYEWVGIQRRYPKQIDSFTESLQHFQRTYDSYFVEKYTEHTAQQSFYFHDDQLLQDFKFVDDIQSLQKTGKLHQVLIRKCINVCFSRVPTHITELTITQSKVENIYGLHNMVQLVHLDLSHNCLVDVYVIQHLLNLKIVRNTMCLECIHKNYFNFRIIININNMQRKILYFMYFNLFLNIYQIRNVKQEIAAGQGFLQIEEINITRYYYHFIIYLQYFKLK